MKAVNTFLQHFKHFSSLFFTKISRDFTIFFIKWISTHTSLVGCDKMLDGMVKSYDGISTHTSLVGCDIWGTAFLCKLTYFYSHIPCGMWRIIEICVNHRWWFLLTHPLWDVTKSYKCFKLIPLISTHTSLVGCDILLTQISRHIIIGVHPVK